MVFKKFAATAAVLLAFAVSQPGKTQPVQNLQCDVGKQLNLPVTEWVDTQQPTKATFIAVHGLTLYAGAFNDIANHLAADGYRVYALDMRGFGRWMNEAQQYGGNSAIHIGQSQIDLLNLVHTIKNDNPKQKIYFLGESQGANLALWVVETHPDETDGAILFSPCYRTRVHPTVRWIRDAFSQLCHPDKIMDLEPYTRPYLTNDPVLTEKCDKDPLVNRKMTPAELVKSLIDNKRAIRNIKQLPQNYPILMIAGTKDGVFNSNSLPKEIKKFGDARAIKLVLLQGKGHLLIEHQPVDPNIAKLIDQWLEEQNALVAERKTINK
jgi:alpha-beta hydrolase superfamily lysophospholipase